MGGLERMGKLGQWERRTAVAEGDAGVPASPMSAENASLVEQLYRTHARELSRYIASRFGLGPPEPEEVAQMAFSRLAATPEVARMANPRGYLYAIACNVVVDHRRRIAHRGSMHLQWTEAGQDEISELSPERVAMGQERFALFEQALRSMPAMRRRIFLLTRADGLSVTVVAQRFGISENAVHKHVSRALQDCAAYLERMDSTRRRAP